MRRIAWVGVALHAVGLVLALVGMRPGSPLVERAARMSFVARAPIAWEAGWGTWMLCALALVALVAAVAERVPGWTTRAALAIAASGAAIDLTCDALWMTLMPPLARDTGGAATYALVERALGVGGQVVANGLYTVATALVAAALLGRRLRHATPLAVGVVLGGGAMVVGGFADSPELLQLSTGPAIVCWCGWALVVAHGLERS